MDLIATPVARNLQPCVTHPEGEHHELHTHLRRDR